MGVGGSIQSVTLDGRIFSVASDADSNRKLGGFENEVQSNGDGSARVIKTRTNWMLDGLAINIDDVRADQEFLQELSDSNVFFTCLIVYASGESYNGEGQLVGDLQVSSNATTATIALNGQGKLTRQE